MKNSLTLADGPAKILTNAERTAITELFPAPPTITDEVERMAYSMHEYNNTELSYQQREELDLLVLRYCAENYEASSRALMEALYRVFERVLLEGGNEFGNYTHFKEVLVSILPNGLINRLFKTTGTGTYNGTPAFYAIAHFFEAIAVGLMDDNEGFNILSEQINLSAGTISYKGQVTGLETGKIVTAMIESDDGEDVSKQAREAITEIVRVYHESEDENLRRSGPSGYVNRMKAPVRRMGIDRGARKLPLSVCQVKKRHIKTPQRRPIMSDGQQVRDNNGRPMFTNQWIVYELYVPLNDKGEPLDIVTMSQVEATIRAMGIEEEL